MDQVNNEIKEIWHSTNIDEIALHLFVKTAYMYSVITDEGW